MWWTEPTGALVAALAGAGLGILGAVYGTLVGVLAPRGRAKGLVIGLHVGILALGLAVLVLGIVALAAGQPFHVVYPLALPGLLAVSVFGALLPVVRRRYASERAGRG